MPSVWTIHATGGDSDGSELHGCHIQVSGNTYQFTEPSIQDVLATTTGTTLPTPPFTFPVFEYEGHNWTIDVSTLTAGHSQNKAEGTWSNDDPGITAEQDGTWTAQAGSTIDPEEEDASSAKA